RGLVDRIRSGGEAREGDRAAVGRPGRTEVEPGREQRRRMASAAVDGVERDGVVQAREPDEGDALTARRERRHRVVGAARELVRESACGGNCGEPEPVLAPEG